MCDRQDIGVSIDGGAEGSVPEGGDEPRIFIYDNYPGGIGFSEPLSSKHDLLLEHTHALVSGCPCEQGCPACVGPVGNTGPLAKAVALRVLDALRARSGEGRELAEPPESAAGGEAPVPVARAVADEVPL